MGSSTYQAGGEALIGAGKIQVCTDVEASRSFGRMRTVSGRSRPIDRATGMPLAWRIFAVNAIVVTAGLVALALSPATVSSRVLLQEAAILAGGLVVLLVVNLFLVRRSLDPLLRVMQSMRRTNLLEPGERLDPSGPAEVQELVAVFDEMVDRLRDERRESGRRALAAQESERKRVAQELHDEIGQSLTAVKLQLARLARRAPAELHTELREAEEEVDRSLGDVRRIALRLRPEALDDLGLVPALTALTTDLASRTGLHIVRRIDPGLPPLGPDGELVIFRVAQESLTNTARHAQATSVELRLEKTKGGVRLVVRDDGIGLDGSHPGSGIEGMKERALLVAGHLEIVSLPDDGTEVRLELPRTA
jgi:two-component system sensor histidine kinase UhpB